MHNLISDLEVDIMQMKLALPRTVHLLEKFCASITLGICLIPDESVLNQLEVIKLNVHCSTLSCQYQLDSSRQKVIESLLIIFVGA